MVIHMWRTSFGDKAQSFENSLSAEQFDRRDSGMSRLSGRIVRR
jgi:hypothetical protein